MPSLTGPLLCVAPFSRERLDLFAHAARLGSDVLEICIEDPALIRPDEIAEAAASAGIGVSVCGAFGPSRDLSSEDPAVRAQGLVYLRTCIDIAADVGSTPPRGAARGSLGRCTRRQGRPGWFPGTLASSSASGPLTEFVAQATTPRSTGGASP